jgi:hypothetical protein
MNSERVATPLPASPTRGEVLRCGLGTHVPQAPAYTLPLVGRVGEGVSVRAEVSHA